jgi:hypothetical protein
MHTRALATLQHAPQTMFSPVHGIRVLWRILAVLLVAQLSACLSVDDFILDGVEFRNSKARYPGIPDNDEKLLAKSKCFWLGGDEEVDLSWESVATAHEKDSGQTYRIGSCNNENADTGGAEVNGHRLASPPWRTFVPASFQSCTDTYFDDNAYGECRVRSNCTEISNACHGDRNWNFPYCETDCREDPATDTTYRTFVGPPAHFGMPLEITPTFYPVDSIRTLSRRMTYEAEGSDTESARFSWRVPKDDGEVWEDNFSPNLFISRVRAFVPVSTRDHLSRRRYLRLEKVIIGNDTVARVWTCNQDPDDATQATSLHCDPLAATVPTYSYVRSHDDVGVRTVWRVDLSRSNPENIAVGADTPVFIEFTVVNRNGQSAGPRISPDSVDLGQAAAAQQRRAVAAFTITNDKTPASWRVDSVSLRGPNASEFSIATHGTRTPPFDLPPLGSFSLDATLNSTSQGQKTALATVQMHTSSGASRALTGTIHAVAAGPALLHVLPPRLFFSDSHSFPWRRNFIVENDGPTPMIRGVIAVSGPGQFAFRLRAEDGVSPVPASKTLDPGQGEIISVFYCPQTHDAHDATVTVISNVSGSPSAPTWDWKDIQLSGNYSTPAIAVCVQQ